ncbi:MAG: GNAT family N-acetyltransferase [Actinobacteria bacterium]|nr:GNAT family N-acetyltransferase [Actinomycetota bacterium]
MDVVDLSEDLARELCAWRYEPPFDVYDTPDYDDAVRAGWAIGDPARRAEQFRAVIDGGSLRGFSRLFTRRGRLLLGVGMAPSGTGRGAGAEFMEVVLSDAASRHPGQWVEAEVRPFNLRALRCYRAAGFSDAGTRTISPLGEDVDVLVMSVQLPGTPGRPLGARS